MLRFLLAILAFNCTSEIYSSQNITALNEALSGCYEAMIRGKQ
jgi:hypothetical protein